MAYTREINDKAFRRINLKMATIPPFQPFSSEAQVLDCQEDEVVLEVQKNDGSTVIIEKPDKKMLVCAKSAPNCILVPIAIPTAHLGICQPGCPNVRYVLPEDLPSDGRYKYVSVPAAATAELCGDAYFNAAYSITNN